MLPVTGDVELTGVGGAGAVGEEGDDVPLLVNHDPEPSPATPLHVYPRPNSSYTRDHHSWASKLVFSWINPVLDKVRRVFPTCWCTCLTHARVTTVVLFQIPMYDMRWVATCIGEILVLVVSALIYLRREPHCSSLSADAHPS